MVCTTFETFLGFPLPTAHAVGKTDRERSDPVERKQEFKSNCAQRLTVITVSGPVTTIQAAMQPMWSTWSHPIRRIGRSAECSHFLKCVINHQTGTRVSTNMWKTAKTKPP